MPPKADREQFSPDRRASQAASSVTGGGTQVHWDENQPKCYLCDAEFGSGVRRPRIHHCRFCGKCVCNDCSPGTALFEDGPGNSSQQRICTKCAPAPVAGDYIVNLRGGIDIRTGETVESALAWDRDQPLKVTRLLTLPGESRLRAEVEVKGFVTLREHDNGYRNIIRGTPAPRPAGVKGMAYQPGSAISQAEYESVRAENDALRKQLEEAGSGASAPPVNAQFDEEAKEALKREHEAVCRRLEAEIAEIKQNRPSTGDLDRAKNQFAEAEGKHKEAAADRDNLREQVRQATEDKSNLNAEIKRLEAAQQAALQSPSTGTFTRNLDSANAQIVELTAKHRAAEDQHIQATEENTKLSEEIKRLQEALQAAQSAVPTPAPNTPTGQPQFEFDLPHSQDWKDQFVAIAEKKAEQVKITAKEWSLANFVVTCKNGDRIEGEFQEPEPEKFPLKVEYH